MLDLERGTLVRVVDPEDEYSGLEGKVTGSETGMISGRTVVLVQLHGRPRWDVEGFYAEQLEVAA